MYKLIVWIYILVHVQFKRVTVVKNVKTVNVLPARKPLNLGNFFFPGFKVQVFFFFCVGRPPLMKNDVLIHFNLNFDLLNKIIISRGEIEKKVKNHLTYIDTKENLLFVSIEIKYNNTTFIYQVV